MRKHPPAKDEVIYNTGLAIQKKEAIHSRKQYWPIRSKLAIIDGITMKGKRIRIPFPLQKQILQQLHSNHMSIEKIRLLVCESVYLVDINVKIKNTVKQCPTYMEYMQIQLHENTIPYKIPCKPWEVIGADIFFIKNNILL